MSLNTILNLTVKATQTRTLDLSTTEDILDKRYAMLLSDGIGAGKASKRYADIRTLPPGTSEELDLKTIGVDPFGDSISFSKIKALLIANTATVAGDTLTVGGALTNPWVSFGDGEFVIEPGAAGQPGVLFIYAPTEAGLSVAADNKVLNITNNSATNPISYAMIIVGE